MPTCLAVVSDMIFARRITATAEREDGSCRIIQSLEELDAALGELEPMLAIVDMHCDGLSPDDAIRAVKTRHPRCRVVAYYSHVQTDLAREAQSAGADDVWPRSVFVQRLVDLLAPGH